jgi:hypothetical protein
MYKTQTSTRLAGAALSLLMTLGVLAVTNDYSRPVSAGDGLAVKLEPVVIRGERIAQQASPVRQAGAASQAEPMVSGDEPKRDRPA